MMLVLAGVCSLAIQLTIYVGLSRPWRKLWATFLLISWLAPPVMMQRPELFFGDTDYLPLLQPLFLLDRALELDLYHHALFYQHTAMADVFLQPIATKWPMLIWVPLTGLFAIMALMGSQGNRDETISHDRLGQESEHRPSTEPFNHG